MSYPASILPVVGAMFVALPTVAIAGNPTATASAAVAANGAQWPVPPTPGADPGSSTASLESHMTTYSGFYRASDGYDDRFVVGNFTDLYRGDTGIHADLLYVNREENGGYAALGVSRSIRGLGRVKLMAGTSTQNSSVLPKLYLSAGLELQPAKGLIVRPTVSYRKFRTGSAQITPAVQVAHYFGGGSAGYFVVQGDASLAFTNSGRTGWSIAGGLTNVRSNGLRFGMAMRRGRMAYDSVVGTSVRSSFYGGGPNIGYRISGGQELFVRTDVTKTRFYTVTGAVVGFKVRL